MPSEAPSGGGGEQRRQVQTTTKPQPAEPDNLKCPRCDSTNTKFCYYNNYNLSQPRYFCKSCRRYWTRGGTLRNVPIGGGSRKNSKRSRPTSSSVSTLPPPPPPPPPLSAFSANTTSSSFEGEASTNVSEPSFMSLLTANELSQGFGVGLGYGLVQSGFEDMGLGLGFGFGSAVEIQRGGSEGGAWSVMDGGDYHLGWPDLAISTLGKGLE